MITANDLYGDWVNDELESSLDDWEREQEAQRQQEEADRQAAAQAEAEAFQEWEAEQQRQQEENAAAAAAAYQPPPPDSYQPSPWTAWQNQTPTPSIYDARSQGTLTQPTQVMPYDWQEQQQAWETYRDQQPIPEVWQPPEPPRPEPVQPLPPPSTPITRDTFLSTLAPYAYAVQNETGIPANIMLGIAANETGWGRYAAGNNYFGIKGRHPDTGASFTSPTWEVVNGQRVNTTDTFRSYSSPEESFRDFARFLRENPRYAGALQQTGDPEQFIRAVHRAGYATDPNWSNQVLSIARQVPAPPPPAPPEEGNYVEFGGQRYPVMAQAGGDYTDVNFGTPSLPRPEPVPIPEEPLQQGLDIYGPAVPEDWAPRPQPEPEPEEQPQPTQWPDILGPVVPEDYVPPEPVPQREIQERGNLPSVNEPGTVGNPDLVPNQYGDPVLTKAQADAACGPAAAVAFARVMGRNPTVSEALALAQGVGWTAGGGMNGIQNQARLLDSMGIPNRMIQTGERPDESPIIRDIQSGNPVTISSGGHYFVADAYRDGRYHVGTSGTVVSRYGGSAWMTMAEMNEASRRLTAPRPSGINGLLFLDNPATPTPSIASLGDVSENRPVQGTPQAAAALQGLNLPGRENAPQVPAEDQAYYDQLAEEALAQLDQPPEPQTWQERAAEVVNLFGQGSGAVADTAAASIARNAPTPTNEPLPDYTGGENRFDPGAPGRVLMEQVQQGTVDPFRVGTAVLGSVSEEASQGLAQLVANSFGQAVTGDPYLARVAQEQGPDAAWNAWWSTYGQELPAPFKGLIEQGPAILASAVAPALLSSRVPVVQAVGRGAAAVDVATSGPFLPLAALGYGSPARQIEEIAGALDPNAPFRSMPGPTPPEATPVRPGAERWYHGTTAAFDTPEAARLDPRDSHGAAYYLAAEPDFAGGHAVERAGAQGGAPNIRPVDVPADLRLLDDTAPVPDDVLDAIAQRYGDDVADRLTGRTVERAYDELRAVIAGTDDIGAKYGPGPTTEINQLVTDLGYDGFRYQIRSADGQHDALAILPAALPRLTNALSGRQGGQAAAPFAADLGGAALGAAVATAGTDPEEMSPQELVARAALGAAGGFAGMRGSRALADVLGTRADAALAARRAGQPARQIEDLARATRGNQPFRAGLGPTPTEPPEFAGNILLRKYPEEIQQPILREYTSNPQLFEEARRGVISDEVVRDLSRYSGIDTDTIVKRWKPGQAANAETALALREAMARQANVVLDAQEAFRAAPAGGASPLMQTLGEELLRYRGLQEVVAGVTAEAGRALRQFTQDVTGAPVSAAARRLEELMRMAQKSGKLEEFETLLRETDLTDPAKVAGMARSLYGPKPTDYANWYIYFNMLTAPPGRIRDAVSNGLALASSIVEPAFAAPWAAYAGVMTNTPRARYAREVPQRLAGAMMALPDASKQALQVLKQGFTEGELVGAELGAMVREPVRIPGKYGPVEIPDELRGLVPNVHTRIIRANDAFYSALQGNADLYGQAYRQARVEGLSGPELAARVAEIRADPPAQMVEAITAARKYHTFQQGGKFVDWAAAGKEKLTLGPVPVARIFVPFHQTPYNIAKYTLERSPLAAFALVPNVIRMAQGMMTPGEFADYMGRMSIGTGIALGMWQLAQQDLLTGAVPRDESDRDAFYRQGKQPYSMNVGGEWRSYQWAQPFSTILAGMATAADLQKKGQNQQAQDIVGIMLLGTARALVDQPFTQGLSDVLELMEKPADQWGTAFTKYVTKTVPSLLMPASAFFRFLARASDQVVRDPGESGSFPQDLVEGVFASIPGATGKVPAKLNAFGQEIARPTGQLGLVGGLDITRPSEPTRDPVEIELANLQQWADANHVRGPQPGFPEPGLPQGVEPKRMTREQYRALQMQSGPQAYARILSQLGTPEWERLGPDAKIKRITDMVRDEREMARANLELPTARTPGQPWRWMNGQTNQPVQSVELEQQITRNYERQRKGEPLTPAQERMLDQYTETDLYTDWDAERHANDQEWQQQRRAERTRMLERRRALSGAGR